MRVLVADESRALRTILRQTLERTGPPGAEIVEAEDGRKAVFALGNADLVVTDWDLPGLRGLAFVRALRDAGLVGRTKILFLIHRSQRSLVAEVQRFVPCQFIERPFNEEDFARKIRSIHHSIEVERAEAPAEAPARLEAPPKTPFLLRLSSDLIDEFLRSAMTSHHPAGTVLLRAGEVCDALHVITGGETETVPGGRRAGQGETFGEASFLTGEPSPFLVRARTSVQLASLSKVATAALLGRAPHMGDFLASLLDSPAPVRAPAEPRGDTEFSGTLQTMSFADIVQFLQLARKTGTLRLELGDQKGGIYVEGGEARHAWAAGKSGEEAFLILASWSSAIFSFSSGTRGDPATIQRPTTTLLLDTLRRIDESIAVSGEPSSTQVA
jgi:two-component system chemotaxis response regulator CheY